MTFIETMTEWAIQTPWLEHAKSFALPLAGVYVAHKFGRIQADIGRRQANTAAQAMATNREKLRLDLFDRRLVVYEAANKFITKAARGDRLNSDHRLDLLRDTNGATWLFDERTAQYITDTLFSDAYEVVRISEELETEPNPQERQRLYQQRNMFCATFKKHSATLKVLLAPYLRFTDRATASELES
ncbi:hypothetical protein [Comamonas sp.]|uniref:hypothetical protein n=1 Tax=Comamonas sp. TaxID=34028 RepID=UPI0028A109AB|nr:hypothetical protein [Comamonas sp.]